MTKDLLKNIMEKIKDLPPLPQSTQKILETTGNDASSARHLAEVLERDQALTTKVLKLVNSSYYGFSREISTISQAVVYLGFNTIKSIALAATSYDMLNTKITTYDMEKGMLWQHSITCAFCARLIAKKIHFPDPEEAYIAGLIHDVGKLMIERYAHDKFINVLDLKHSELMPFDVAEKEILGFDHAEIGGKIAEKWNFPLGLVEAISFHHQPEFSKHHQKLTYIIHLADSITEIIGVGIGSDGLKYNFQPETFKILNLDEKEIEGFILHLSDLINSGELEKI